MDNIDHNPSATSATTSFHGTSISLFQHPTLENEGESREQLSVTNRRTKKVPELPDSYTILLVSKTRIIYLHEQTKLYHCTESFQMLKNSAGLSLSA
jgi:hypothetical protein